ncbi:HalD/BesD family halogenase [Streptomyces kunmingensis]
MDRARREFLTRGFTKISFLAPEETENAIAGEIESLVESHGVRREMRFDETGGTPRRMRNVRHREIREHGSVIPAVYRSAEFRAALSRVAGERVLECPYEPEQYVITELQHSGDTHRWHGDDYGFAVVWVVDCPPVEHGGFVQCVPRTHWNRTGRPRAGYSRAGYSRTGRSTGLRRRGSGSTASPSATPARHARPGGPPTRPVGRGLPGAVLTIDGGGTL